MPSATEPGSTNVLARPRSEARRHATRGPMPISRSNGRPKTLEEEVVVRPADDHCLAANGFREKRPRDAPQDRQRERDEEQVVVEERSFTRDEGLQSRLHAQERQPVEDHRRRERRDDDDEREEPGPDRALCERVDRGDHARAGEERPEQGEPEREADERDVPDLQHPALLLNHHAVEVRGRHEPGHQRGVLHRVPGVVPAPPHLDVRPVGTEQLPDPERRPGDQRPTPRRDDPALVGSSGEEGTHRERERHREPDVAEIEQRRVGDHVRVLEAGVQSGAVRAVRPGARTGWPRRRGARRRRERHPPAPAQSRRRRRGSPSCPGAPRPPRSRSGRGARAAVTPPGRPRRRRWCTRWAARGSSAGRRIRTRSRGARVRRGAPPRRRASRRRRRPARSAPTRPAGGAWSRPRGPATSA